MDILEHYEEQRQLIRQRLKQFKQFFSEPVLWTYANGEMKLLETTAPHDERLFEELAFCILAANTSAEMGMKTLERLRSMLHHASPEEMTAAIRGMYRFINLRPQYIVHTREYLKRMDVPLHHLVASFNNPYELRDFLANNMGIKGIGYKEASHFLRNIGMERLAILDKHIVSSMHEFGILSQNKTPSSKKHYLEMEQLFLEWAERLCVHPDELDLLLWGRKTGKILK